MGCKEANGIEVPKQGKGKKSSIVKESEAEELKRLRKKLKLVQQERDILKKATAPQEYFLATLTARILPRKFCEIRMDREESNKFPNNSNV